MTESTAKLRSGRARALRQRMYLSIISPCQAWVRWSVPLGAKYRKAPSARADGEWTAGCCPILGAKWERRFTVRWGQTRSDGVSVAISTRLTCGNVLDQ